MIFKNLGRGQGTDQDQAAAVAHERQHRLHTEEHAARVDGEVLVIFRGGHLFGGRQIDDAGVRDIDVEGAEPTPNFAGDAAVMFQVGDIAPDAATAASRTSWRRPVMATCAPSWTNNRAMALPIPLLPPVTTAVLSLRFVILSVPEPFEECAANR